MWIIRNVIEGIWGFIIDLATDIINNAFNLITDLILQPTNLNEYININTYLYYIRIIAGSLLALAVVWEGFKQLSGNMIPEDHKSLTTITLQTVLSGCLIWFLPWSVTNIFLRLNNLLIDLIQYIGVIEPDELKNSLSLVGGVKHLGGLHVTLTFILGIAFLLLGIAGGIRYIELILALLISPIVAVSAVRKGEAIQVWVRETTAIVFTQSIHVFLLQVLMKIMLVLNGVMMFVLAIGTIVVLIRGPQILRKYLYSSGTSSGAIAAVGTGGRLAAMKIMMKPIK